MSLSLLLAGFLTLVELNCENLFDCRHDSLRQDTEFLPEGVRHWTPSRYWNKLNMIGQTILSCADDLPDLVALCEVENDTVMHDLTRRSVLRTLGYEYLMTESADPRGIDVALLYQPAMFRALCYEWVEVPAVPLHARTRDILYVKGMTREGDTLHVFVLHAPSRRGGEKASRAHRVAVATRLCSAIDEFCPSPSANIVVTGDFNDDANSRAMQLLLSRGLLNVSDGRRGRYGAKGTYRYKGRWQSLDHVLLSPSLAARVDTVYINDAPFLLEQEPRYGGQRPRRTYNGYRYQHAGVSDHLPLVVRLRKED